MDTAGGNQPPASGAGIGTPGPETLVIRNGEKTDQIIVPDKSDKQSFRTLQIRVSPTELVYQIKHGESWTVLDRRPEPPLTVVGTCQQQTTFPFR